LPTLARVLPGAALRVPIFEHCRDPGVKLEQPVVRLGATSESLEPRLFCVSDHGHSGQLHVSSSRTLYRKKPEK
jgi:hypothetical protein